MFDFNKDSGDGNLDLRALFAALVGPQRVAQGAHAVKNVPQDRAIEIARNGGRAPSVLFVSATLSADFLSTIVGVKFTSSGSTGNAAHVVALSYLGKTGEYSAVLLPNEQLYAQVIGRVGGGAALPDPLPLIVTTVTF